MPVTVIVAAVLIVLSLAGFIGWKSLTPEKGDGNEMTEEQQAQQRDWLQSEEGRAAHAEEIREGARLNQ
jgi:hypothetical protein